MWTLRILEDYAGRVATAMVNKSNGRCVCCHMQISGKACGPGVTRALFSMNKVAGWSGFASCRAAWGENF